MFDAFPDSASDRRTLVAAMLLGLGVAASLPSASFGADGPSLMLERKIELGSVAALVVP